MNQSTLNIRIEVDDKGSIQIKKLGNELNDTGDKGKTAASKMGAAFSELRTIIGGIALAALGKQIIGIMDQYTQLESRLKLVTTGSENLAQVQNALYDISLRSHVSQASTIDLYTRMARATDQLGYSQETTLQITETINKALIISGDSAASADAAVYQLGQGLSAGALRGEDFNSVMEQTPRLARAIADGLGVNTGELRKMAEQGQLTSEVVTRALISQRDVIESEFGQMTKTIGQAMTDLSTVFNTIIHEGDKSADGTRKMVSAIDDLANTVESNKDAIISIFSGVVQGAAWAVEAISNITRSVQGLAIVAASEDKGLSDWMKADVATMKVWQEEFANGTAFVRDQIAVLTEKRKNLAIVVGDAFNSDQVRAAAAQELAATNKQISALNTQIEVTNTLARVNSGNYADSWMIAAQSATVAGTTIGGVQTGIKDSWEILGELQKTSAKEIDAAEVKIFKEKQAREEKGAKERETQLNKEAEGRKKYSDEISALEAQLTTYTNSNTQSRHDYALQKLGEQYQAKLNDAKGDMDRIAEVAAWHKAEKDRLAAEDTARGLQQRTQENNETTAHLTDLTTKNQEHHSDKVQLGEQWVENTKTNIQTIDADESRSHKERWAAEERGYQDRVAQMQKELEERKKHAEEVKKLEAHLTDEINKATLSKYEYAVQKLNEEIAEARKTAAAKMATQDQITEYHRIQLAKIQEFDNMYSADEQKRLDEMRDSFMVHAEEKTAITAEEYQKQEALSAELAVYMENLDNTKLAGELSRLEKAYQAKLKYVGDNKETQANLDRWYKAEQELIVIEDAERSLAKKKSESDAVATHLHDLTLKNQDHFLALTALEEMWAETSKTIKSELGDALVEEFGGIEGAWGALWDSMLRKMGDVVAQMAVNWAYSGVATLFKDWQMPKIFHEGIWTLKDDEVPAILQMGEMVIPRGYADEIRTFLGGNGPDNWDGLLDATRNYGASGWGSATDGMVAGSLKDRYSGFMTSGIPGIISGQTSFGQFFSTLTSPEFAVSAISSALADTAVSPWSPEPSNYSNFGAATGRGLMMAGLAAAGLPGMASGALGSLGALAGGWVGDLVGDAMDARAIGAASVEGIYDALEDGLISSEQAKQMARDQVAQMTREMQRIDDKPTFGLVASSISSTIDKMTAYLERSLSSAESAHQSTFMGYGPGNSVSTPDPGKFYGEAGVSRMDGSGATVGRIDGSEAIGGSLEAGINSESVGRGDHGGEGSGGYGYGDDNAYSTGGVVKRLLVPQGDDGWGALKLGEGVIDADTMKILSAAIRAGQFPAQKDGGNEELVALLWTIASSTKKSADILTRIEYTGIPQTDRRAVA